WGSVFYPNINLKPKDHYIYNPVWNLSGGMTTLSAAQQLYETAQNQVSDSNYVAAKVTFQQLVNNYPDEEPAKHSLKELLYLEPLAGNNFDSLRNWYLTNSVILSHPELLELAKELAVKCDEKLENYQSSIDWYESIIQDPPTLEDSVFAIIDLEHLYWIMGIDTTLRNAVYIGKLSQYIPESFRELRNERDYLLSLLHTNTSSSSIANKEELNKTISLTNNYQIINLPNPFKSITTFRFKTQFVGDFNIKVYDQNGKIVKNINLSNLNTGEHDIRINMDDLKPGIYYYSLNSFTGIISSNKMIITN
ncbi:MAG: T9SS type A sorting domain-containing protein, partial [Chlorobi bacterium]|nr:T9SS type A sorting domain-containing protein [Chlorobiota bacterium]